MILSFYVTLIHASQYNKCSEKEHDKSHFLLISRAPGETSRNTLQSSETFFVDVYCSEFLFGLEKSIVIPKWIFLIRACLFYIFVIIFMTFSWKRGQV